MSTPNEHGVFEGNDLVMVYGDDEYARIRLSVDLAQSDTGWHFGYGYRGRQFGSFGPCVAGNGTYESRQAALNAALSTVELRLLRDWNGWPGAREDIQTLLSAIKSARAPQLSLFEEAA